MEFETYADVIDSYNLDNQGYSTLTDYIKGNNIKIKEIDMDPMGDFEKIIKGSVEGVEEDPMRDRMKQPMPATGIRKLAAAKDMDVNIELVVKEFIKKKGRRPRSLEEIKDFYMDEYGAMSLPNLGPDSNKSNVMLASYKPGDYDQDDIDAYENYKYQMNEQMPGFPIMDIDDFLRIERDQGRAGVAAGGLPAILGV
tara:strand:+ start:211 stop:801 length:591 start_codon:yes stop_codon:yes gene_type:complete